MPFQLPEATQVTITNANPRRELHGEEKVRAIDLSFSLTGENTLLDLIEPGLREHHFCNKALKDGQETLPDVVIPLPNLRHPNLPLSYHYAKGQKWRGYRFQQDYGTDEARIDFTDAVLASLQYEITEGGSCTIKGTVQYNGDELTDNDLYGMLSGLASEGDIHIRLIAPGELIQAKKGYRAGKPDTPTKQAADGQGEIDDTGDDETDEGDDEIGPDTPEAAFINSGAAVH
ncbi:MAG: hypothetical protein V4669_13830 [Pseudomonadota bacterium]